MKKKTLTKITIYLLCVILGLCGGFLGWVIYTLPHDEELIKGETPFYTITPQNPSVNVGGSSTPASGTVSVHFLELGNKYTGDCTYIKVGENIDILIDCGSRANSVGYVKNYLDSYVTDGILDYVIVTHAHQDHYAGFATTSSDSIFDLYYCDTIVTFSGTTSTKTNTSLYKKFVAELNSAKTIDTSTNTTKPSNVKTVKDYIDSNPIINLDPTNNITLQFLETEFTDTPDTKNENNNSVCCMINQGDKNFLFTGDLEGEGEESLISMNSLPKVELYKAGHHGSGTSSSADLCAEIFDVNNPAVVCVCCCAGSSEYSTNLENQFPTKAFVERVSIWTTLVYVTTLCIDYKNNEFVSFNGNITISSSSTGLSVKGSNNDVLLKDSDWFKQNRYQMCYDTMHSSWR